MEARERIFKAVAFAKLLRKDLEVSAEFSLKGNPSDLIKKLCQTKHVKVRSGSEQIKVTNKNLQSNTGKVVCNSKL